MERKGCINCERSKKVRIGNRINYMCDKAKEMLETKKSCSYFVEKDNKEDCKGCIYEGSTFNTYPCIYCIRKNKNLLKDHYYGGKGNA